jgi:hypothetical protein
MAQGRDATAVPQQQAWRSVYQGCNQAAPSGCAAAAPPAACAQALEGRLVPLCGPAGRLVLQLAPPAPYHAIVSASSDSDSSSSSSESEGNSGRRGDSDSSCEGFWGEERESSRPGGKCQATPAAQQRPAVAGGEQPREKGEPQRPGSAARWAA